MNGLIVKDFIVLKHNIKFYLMLTILYAIIGMFSDLSSFVLGLVAVLGISFVLGSFGYDEEAKWDQYALSLAVTRREMVRAKYLVAFLLTGITVVISFVLTLISQLIHGNLDIMQLLLYLGVFFAVMLLMTALILPCIYRFGAEKGRAVMILCILAVAGLVVLFLWAGEQTPLFSILLASPLLSVLLIACVLLFFLYLSYHVSLKIYLKKDMG